MERPIILGVDGESREIIEDGGCGIPIEPESAEELAASVLCLAGDPKRRREMGRKGRRFVTENYDRARLADDYLILMEELVS